MKTTELTHESLDSAEAAIPEGAPFIMLNLLRFNERAEYEMPSDLPAVSGMEAYMQRYVPAFASVATRYGQEKNSRPVFLGTVLATLVSPEDEPWDLAVLVEYDNLAALRTVVQSAEYQTDADPHRRAALANWRFIALSKQPLG